MQMYQNQWRNILMNEWTDFWKYHLFTYFWKYHLFTNHVLSFCHIRLSSRLQCYNSEKEKNSNHFTYILLNTVKLAQYCKCFEELVIGLRCAVCLFRRWNPLDFAMWKSYLQILKLIMMTLKRRVNSKDQFSICSDVKILQRCTS